MQEGEAAYVQLIGSTATYVSGIIATVQGPLSSAEGGGTLVELQDGTFGKYVGPVTPSQPSVQASSSSAPSVAGHQSAASEAQHLWNEGQSCSAEDPMAYLMSIGSAGARVMYPFAICPAIAAAARCSTYTVSVCNSIPAIMLAVTEHGTNSRNSMQASILSQVPL
jgi:hypothetical protein